LTIRPFDEFLALFFGHVYIKGKDESLLCTKARGTKKRLGFFKRLSFFMLSPAQTSIGGTKTLP
jgi:hypothetical protein